MLTVGLLGATGYMGSAICSGLITAFRNKQLGFVILHQPSSNTSRYPSDVEKRQVDLVKGDIVEIGRAIKGLNVVISAISGRALTQQLPLLDALRQSTDLVTFFPSEWATPFTDEDVAGGPYLSSMKTKAEIVDRARQRGVPVTVVKNGTTPELLFGSSVSPAQRLLRGAEIMFRGFSSFEPKANRVNLYSPRGKGTRGLTSKDFTGAAIVHLLLNRLNDLPNHTFSLVELDFSSDDIITTFSELHNGDDPEIIEYTENDYRRDLKDGLMGAMRAGRMKGLAVGCDWTGEKVQGFTGWQEKTLEEYVREFM